MIPVGKIFEAFRAGVGAARAVMDGRGPVLVEDVLAAEGCVCPEPRVVVVHNRGTRCGDEQYQLVQGDILEELWEVVEEVLDLLAEEADRRDGVRRGPR